MADSVLWTRVDVVQNEILLLKRLSINPVKLESFILKRTSSKFHCTFTKSTYTVSNILLTNSHRIFSSNFLIAQKNSRYQLNRFDCHPSLKVQQLCLCHQKIWNLRFISNTCEQHWIVSVQINGKQKLVKLEAHLRQYRCVYFLLTNTAYPITNTMPTPFHFIHKFYKFVLN